MALMLGMFLFAYREQWLMVAFLGISSPGPATWGQAMVFPVLILALQASWLARILPLHRAGLHSGIHPLAHPSASFPTWSTSTT